MLTIEHAIANFLAKNPSDEDIVLLQQNGLIECRNAEEFKIIESYAAQKDALNKQYNDQIQVAHAANKEYWALETAKPRWFSSKSTHMQYQAQLTKALQKKSNEEAKQELAKEELERSERAAIIVWESLESTMGFVRLSLTGRREALKLEEISDAVSGAYEKHIVKQNLECVVAKYMSYKSKPESKYI